MFIMQLTKNWSLRFGLGRGRNWQERKWEEPKMQERQKSMAEVLKENEDLKKAANKHNDELA